MATIQSQIYKIPPSAGGPYAYVVSRDGVGGRFATGLANAAAAFNGARDDMVALIPGGEEVKRISQFVVTGTP